MHYWLQCLRDDLKAGGEISQLTRKLLHDHRLDDLSRATENSEFCKSLMQEYHI